MNGMGMAFSSVGNHEFDQARMNYNACSAAAAAPIVRKRPANLHVSTRAKYTWLAANVIEDRTDKPLLPAYEIREFHGVKIGFVAAVLEDTPRVVVPSGVVACALKTKPTQSTASSPALKARASIAWLR